VVTDANGCQSASASGNLTVNALPTIIAGADQAVCDGGAVTLSGSGASTYAWDNGVTNGTTFSPTATGTYTVTGTDGNGCIGTDQVNVTVNANYYNILPISLCTGDSVLAGGAYQTGSGTFYDSLSSIAGCDSVTETVLTVSSQITVNLPLSVCYGDSALINGNYELANGTFYDTSTSVLGCDSITITNFTVDTLITNSITASICQGDSMMLDGSYQTVAGSYVDTLLSANGCDSVLTTTLIVNPIVTNNLTASICQGDSMLLGGAYQTTDGDYFDTLSTTLGCDSILTTTLIVNPLVTNGVTASICQGDSMMLGGAYQTVAGSYVDTLSTTLGCDSILNTTLTVNDINYLADTITVCYGDSSFIAGAYRTNSGIYVDSLTNLNGCDSIIETTFAVLSENFVSNLFAICNGDSVLAGGLYQTTTGLYYDTLVDANGCNLIIETDLTVSSQIVANLNVNVCYGDSALINGNYELASGTFYDTTVSVAGCDSITITNFIVDSSITNSVTASICQGDSIILGGSYQTVAGSYNDVYSTNSGCDSLVNTILSINLSITDSISANICQGDSLFLGGAYQTANGSYNDVYSTNSGCDSIVTTTLTVDSAITGIDVQQAACDFVWIDGITYNTSDSTSSFTLSSTSGCDSIVTLNLTINPIVTTIVQNGNDIEASSINGSAPYTYQWNTGETTAIITPSANGLYSVVVSDADSCFSDTAIFLVEFVNTTGIEKWNNSVSIYPNPTSDILTISTGKYSGLITTNIYDLFGRKIITTNEKEISLKSFADGVYILELTAGKNSYTTRIIKE
jgi:hypothetical protein